MPTHLLTDPTGRNRITELVLFDAIRLLREGRVSSQQVGMIKSPGGSTATQRRVGKRIVRELRERGYVIVADQSGYTLKGAQRGTFAVMTDGVIGVAPGVTHRPPFYFEMERRREKERREKDPWYADVSQRAKEQERKARRRRRAFTLGA